MDRDEVEVHKHAKKERGQYPVILTEQSWSIKDLLYDFGLSYPSGQDGAILPARHFSPGPARSRSFFWFFIPGNKSFTDLACSVKMAGLAKFFFCVFMD